MTASCAFEGRHSPPNNVVTPEECTLFLTNNKCALLFLKTAQPALAMCKSGRQAIRRCFHQCAKLL
jgi:hypothetical protein